MMKVALEADAATSVPSTPAAGTPTPSPESKPTGDAAAPAPGANDQKPAGETTDGKPADKASGETKADKPGDAKKPDEKQESAYTKAQKEEARKDRSWKALEAEKAAVRAEKEAHAAELAGLKRQVQELESKLKPAAAAQGEPVDEKGITAGTYDRLAKKYDEEGKDDMAKLARDAAAKIRAQPAKPAAEAATASREHADVGATLAERLKNEEFSKRWFQHRDELVKAEPELGDPKNPVVQGAQALLNHPQWGRFFCALPDGVKAAVEVAKINVVAHQAEALKKDLATAKAEIDRLNKLLSPRGSQPAGPAGGGGAKDISKMSPEEAEAEVHRAAAAADRGET